MPSAWHLNAERLSTRQENDRSGLIHKPQVWIVLQKGYTHFIEINRRTAHSLPSPPRDARSRCRVSRCIKKHQLNGGDDTTMPNGTLRLRLKNVWNLPFRDAISPTNPAAHYFEKLFLVYRKQLFDVIQIQSQCVSVSTGIVRTQLMLTCVLLQ